MMVYEQEIWCNDCSRMTNHVVDAKRHASCCACGSLDGSITRDAMGYISSPIFCEHANEMPAYCPCTPDCYCKRYSCASEDRDAEFLPMSVIRKGDPTMGDHPSAGKHLMPTKAYIVVEIGWEHNDENYYRPECGGGTPVKAFRRREAAEAEAYRRQQEWARKCDPEDYRGIGLMFEVKEVELDDDE